jgi:hypothetical protein
VGAGEVRVNCAGCPYHLTDPDMVEAPDCMAGECIDEEDGLKNLFVVRIGNVTRRGCFQETVTRYIETDADQGKVYAYMIEKYAGFDVKVDQINRADLIVIPDQTDQATSVGLSTVKRIRHLADF